MKLNIGCGNKRIDGFVGVDKIPTEATDIIHDLDVFPYPLEENSVDEIIIDNTLEHLADVIRVMEELYRICKPLARVVVKVPYFKSNSAFTDPTHKHFFTETSFKYFEVNNPLHFYTAAIFRVEKVELYGHTEYDDFKHRFRNMLPFRKYLNFIFFNMYDEIRFDLICIKEAK